MTYDEAKKLNKGDLLSFGKNPKVWEVSEVLLYKDAIPHRFTVLLVDPDNENTGTYFNEKTAVVVAYVKNSSGDQPEKEEAEIPVAMGEEPAKAPDVAVKKKGKSKK